LFSIASEDAAKKKISPKDRKVTILHFGRMLRWFGPLEPNPKSSRHDIIHRMRSTLELKYFHGDISSDEAKRRLRGLPNGTFLIRFSGEAGYFVLSRMVGGQFKEGRVEFNTKGFTIDKKNYFPTLSKFVTKLRDNLGVQQICVGSKYGELFTPPFPDAKPTETVTEEKKKSSDTTGGGEKKKKKKKRRETASNCYKLTFDK